MGSRILSVPYKSQNDADATFKRSDCGPCCIAMILAAMGQNVTTNQVTAASGIVGDSGLRLDQMVTTAAAFGLSLFFQSGLGLDDLKRFIDNGQPPIALINYGNIPDRFDQHYTGGHFVLVVGYDDDSGRVFINDPDYPPGSMGYQRPYSFPVFSGAWGGFEPNVNPNFCLVIPQPPKPIPGTATAAPQPVQPAAAGDVWVVAPAGLAFRAQADASAPLIGGLSFGQHLTALGAESGQDATGRTWQQVRTDAGVVGWVAASLSGDRLLSGTQPSAPYPVQVLDTQTVRDAGGLAVRGGRDINLPALDRAQVGERLTVYGSVTEAGIPWLWVQSPRGLYGWVRQQADGVTLVSRVDLEAGAPVDSSTPVAPTPTPPPAPPVASTDVWVIAPAGLALRSQAHFQATVLAGVAFGQHLAALGAETAADGTGRTWQRVQTDANVTGWVAASLGGDRLLSTTQPDEPYRAQVLDTQTARDAGGLAVRERRDINLPALDRVQIGERITVYGRVTETGGSPWLWVQSPRSQFGWVREQVDGVTLVGKIDQAPAVEVRPFGKCLAGLGMGNPQPLTAGQLMILSKSKVEAFKILTLGDPTATGQLIQSVRNIPSIRFIIARLFFAPDAQNRTPFSPKNFVDTVFVGANAAYRAGVRYFEVHNEPNHPNEGMGWNWNNGAEFGTWLIQVINRLRQSFPEAKFGFPGLWPNDNVADFSDGATPAVAQCDWVGAHSYWQSTDQPPFPMTGEEAGMYWRRFRTRFPDKLLMITEFSNNSAGVDPAEKGRQYANYYQMLRQEPNLGAVFGFALNWPGQDSNHEGWESNGRETAIPGTVGSLIGQPGFLP